VELEANSGSSLNGQDAGARVNRYEYVLIYGRDGSVDESAGWQSDWISAGGDAIFAPLNLMEVAESRWQGHNPMVTEANVRSLDTANGGGRQFAGSAPTFKSVAASERGGAPLVPAYSDPFLPGTGGPPPNTSRRPFLGIFSRD
jgi:hypothetical protein